MNSLIQLAIVLGVVPAIVNIAFVIFPHVGINPPAAELFEVGLNYNILVVAILVIIFEYRPRCRR